MKNFIAINGSPRRNGNTATLLQHAVQGAKDAGASAELINLYALNFKGCTSCFACKLKSRPHGSCAMKDDLSPVLEKIKSADAIVFGSPIYFMNLSAGMIAFFERLGMYEGTAHRILRVAPKVLCAYDTVQFKDYSRYESSIFNAEEKFAYREKHFPEDCAAAYDIGRELVSE